LQADWPLQIGQKLLIKAGNVTLSPTPRPLTPIEKITPADDGNYYHTVQSGEYLAWIAELYDISLDQLLAWNGLSSTSVIRPGQKLLLLVTPPPTNTPIPTSPIPTSTITATQTQPSPTPNSSNTPLGPTESVDAVSQSRPSGFGAAILAVLVVVGVLAVVWLVRRSG
jgi:LysM repeat protein